MNAPDIIHYMESLRNEEQRRQLMRFFKTGAGQYGAGDDFLGLKVPQTREVVRLSAGLPIAAIPELLESRWHEVRLCGFLLLVDRFTRAAGKAAIDKAEAIAQRDEVVSLYLRHAHRANNWDLVDLSAPKVVGHWLLLPTALAAPDRGPALALDYKLGVMDRLATSDNLWHQRISMVSTLGPMHHGDASWCLRYAEMHLAHPHDLMHKATGWMLREMGKRCGMERLRDFLSHHASQMPRTALRYAIEKMSPDERQYWLTSSRG